MVLYVQTWLPLLAITLTAAVFFAVASFIIECKQTGWNGAKVIVRSAGRH
jgi:hypothetical protein